MDVDTIDDDISIRDGEIGFDEEDATEHSVETPINNTSNDGKENLGEQMYSMSCFSLPHVAEGNKESGLETITMDILRPKIKLR